MLKILGVVDEFRHEGVTCKNVAETKNLANDNTLLQVRYRVRQVVVHLGCVEVVLTYCLPHRIGKSVDTT